MPRARDAPPQRGAGIRTDGGCRLAGGLNLSPTEAVFAFGSSVLKSVAFSPRRGLGGSRGGEGMPRVPAVPAGWDPPCRIPSAAGGLEPPPTRPYATAAPSCAPGATGFCPFKTPGVSPSRGAELLPQRLVRHKDVGDIPPKIHQCG